MNKLKELNLWSIEFDAKDKQYCIMGYVTMSKDPTDFDLIREPIVRIDFEEMMVSTEKEIYKLNNEPVINNLIKAQQEGEWE